jgi:thiamine biosynthesis lipoprotein
MLQHTFRSMGTDVELLLDVDDPESAAAAFADAEHEFGRIEERFSRFRSDSELSQLNRSGTAPVSAEMLSLLETALDGRQRKGGRFDPTVHDALAASGYDRSFEQIDAASHDPEPAGRPAACNGTVTIDRAAGTVALAAGVRIDLGGIAKGHAADRVAGRLARTGPCLVNAGGDIAVAGHPPGGVWNIGVPTGDGEITLALVSGGLATSGRDRRSWSRAGEHRHHLIDPSTGRSSTSDLMRVTVVGRSAVDAEILAKHLFLMGSEAAARTAERDRLPTVLVTEDGATHYAGGLA